MNVYDTILDPTVVSHAEYGYFTTTECSELLVVRTNKLSIFHKSLDDKLVLQHDFKLSGKITDLVLIPQVESPLNCLLLCSEKAKISIVSFDSQSNGLVTLSLHYYETQFEKLNILEMAKSSKLRIEPFKKCVLMFNNDCMALLPFLHSKFDDDDEDDDNVEETNQNINDKQKKKDSITMQSYICNLSILYKDIQNVVDIVFLKNFSRPTIGVLYQPKLAWAGNTKISENPTNFIIISLDIKQELLDRDITNNNNNMNMNNYYSLNQKHFQTVVTPIIIGKLSDLTWDLHTLLPTATGSLAIGTNTIMFLDNACVLQSTILLNPLSNDKFKKSRIINRMSLNLQLNNTIKHFWSLHPTTQKETLLIMDEESTFYYVQLEAEGRLLINFDLIKISAISDVFKNNSNPTCIICTYLSETHNDINLFVGFQSGNAQLVRLNNIKSVIGSNVKELPKLNSVNIGNDSLDLDDDDDLYSHEEEENENDNNEKKSDEIDEDMEGNSQPFEIIPLTSLVNVGPITSLCPSKVSAVNDTIQGLPNPNLNEYSIIATSGVGTGSFLTEIQPTVQPEIELALKFISITQIWTLKIRNKDKFLVTTDSKNSKSDLYRIDKNFSLYKEGNFRRDAHTVYISMFGDYKRIVQMTTYHLYLYDLNFRRLTTIKFEYEVVNVAVQDPYILVTLSRGDIKLYELDKKQKKKLFKVPLPGILPEMVITSGVILRSNMCNEYLPDVKDSDEETLLFTFVTADNQIIFFPRQHEDRIFQLNGIDELKDMLFISTYQLPDEVVADPSIKQVMINKLGHNSKEEYLTILTFGGEIYQYKKSKERHSRFYRKSVFNEEPITGAPENAFAKGVSSIERVIHYIPDYNGYSVIFVTGKVPYILIKEDDAPPRIYIFTNIPVVSMIKWGKKSIMCVDHIKNARVYTLDIKNTYYGNKLPIKKINISTESQDYKTLLKVAYYEKFKLLIVSYAKQIEYDALDEEGNHLVGYNPDVPHAKSFKSGILLINPKNWEILDEIEFENNSLVNDVRSMLIQVNSKTKVKREYVIAGLANIGHEDLAPSGAFYVYDIIPEIPEHGQHVSSYKFKEIFSEDVRGIVSSVCEVSGRFTINQSQKLMMRDVQEDNSVVPVAFLDIPVYVTDSKSFGNFLIVSDSMQGFQFVGFDAEPYRLIVLGKSMSDLKVSSVEFVVCNGDIYFAVSDYDNILHIFKYAPDEPNSLSGQRLVRCSSFNLFSTTSCMMLLPGNDEFKNEDDPISSYQTVGGQTDGSIYKIVPLDESAYRRLYVVQQQLTDGEPQFAGFNPKMERLSNNYYNSTNKNIKPMLDFNVIRRFSVLPISKRQKISKIAGRRAHFDIWRDLINVEFSLRCLSNS